MSETYLDVGATTRVKSEYKNIIDTYLYDDFYNPSANYTPAFDISKRVADSRLEIAKYIGCKSEEIYFTSGASESNSWAFQGWLRKHPRGVIITSAIEHHSIMAMVEDEYFEDKIWVIPVNNEGVVNPTDVDEAIKKAKDAGRDGILVAIQYANNEIGTIQDIAEISRVAHAGGAKLFTDATQAFSCLDMNDCISKNNIDMLSMSGHKICCPKGIGFLYVKEDVDIPPLIYGSQNFGKRGGTENVAGIITLGLAFHNFRLFGTEIDDVQEQRNILFNAINGITPVKMNGSKEMRLPNNLNVTFQERIIGLTVTSVLSALGVYISVGSACTAQSSEPSHVLKAIGLTDDEASRTIRITLPKNLTNNELNDAIGKFKIALELLLKNKT